MKDLQQMTEKPNIPENIAYAMEEVEKNAWTDMYRAAPHDYALQMGIEQSTEGNAVLITAALPIGLFNKSFMHGLAEELTQKQVQGIKEYFTRHNAKNYYIYTTPFTASPKAAELMAQNGLEIVNATDKVYCDPQKTIIPHEENGAITIKLVTRDNAEGWADFICAVYGGLPNQPWLHALVGRKGWHHLIAEKEGKIIACRSMYIDENNRAWMGIDAPVPGLMTDDYHSDYLICREFVSIAQENRVTLINSCIELINDSRDTEAYRYYYTLGFKVAYRRYNYGLKA